MTFTSLDEALNSYPALEKCACHYCEEVNRARLDEFISTVWNISFEQGYVAGHCDGIEEERGLCNEHCEKARKEERESIRKILEPIHEELTDIVISN